MKAVAPVLPGETLGDKYRVERILGEGGMGIVVAARHLALDERVAIKFLIGEPSEPAVERFLREARAAAKVKGEHVCRVFDFGRLETGEPYIVMEHLEGIDLARKLEREGAQEPALVVGWIIEACAALAEAHVHGIVHRDLKPANLFLATRPDGSSCAKVLDFGISKLPSQVQMTKTTATMGSPAYMSPEQLESSRSVDARSDVWSLGVVLYELLSGRPPFRAQSMIELALTIREKDPPPLEGIPPELHRIVSRCLSKQPGDRYASVVELAAELAPFAPPEVAGLVARLERRKTSPTSERSGTEEDAARSRDGKDDEGAANEKSAPPPSPLAGSVAVESTPPSSLKTPKASQDEGAPEARMRETFAALQSTMNAAYGIQPARKRAYRIAAGVALVAVVSIGGRAALSLSDGAGDEARPSGSAPVETTAVVTAAPTASTPPSTIDSPPPLPAPSASAPPRSSTTAARPTAAPSMAVVPPPPVTVDASAAPSPPASATTSPSTPAEPSRKRRTLDRDDPL